MEQAKVEEIQNFLNTNTNSLLKNFPHIPFDQTIFGCYELNGQIQYGFSPDFDKNIINKHHLPSYENIDDIFKETSNPLIPSQNLNIIERQPLLKKYYNIYMNFGLVALLENLNSQEKNRTNNQKVHEYIVKGSEFLLKIIDCIYAPINPWLIQDREENFDANRIKGDSWANSLIKNFVWHPHSNKYAIAFKNDVVKVYSINYPPVILKHPKQFKITCLAWKPFYSSLIAIGCANCIIIWDTDNLPVSIKPSSSCSILLSKRFHHDIMDLQWYPKSDYLVSVASKDNQIMIWDITQKVCVPIKRIGITGFSICKFNNFSNKLFTADLSTTFRVWRPDNYTSEKWTNLISRCNSACWSPDGNILLFSCHDCQFIYALRFLNKNNQELKVVCDLSNVVFVDNNYSEGGESSIQKYGVGGAIEMMEWDPNGQRLAVIFKKNGNGFNLNVVAVFISKFNPQFQLLPCGLINDNEGSWPAAISFKPNFEQGTLLTIGWSNGRLQHVPFYFSNL